MSKDRQNNFDALMAEVIDADNPLNQTSFISYLAIDELILQQYIEYEIVMPITQQDAVYFDQHSMRRGKIARRLQLDLEVNPAGIVIILDLLERLPKNA